MEDTKKIEGRQDSKTLSPGSQEKGQGIEGKPKIEVGDVNGNPEEPKPVKVEKDTLVQTQAGMVPLLATDKIGIGSRSRGGSVNMGQDLGLTREMLDSVLIYVDDLLVRIDHANNDAKLFDNSLTPEGFQNLMQAFKVKLVTDDKSQVDSLT